MIPEIVVIAAFAWATGLLAAGGLLLLRASDILHRLVALEVLGSIVIILLTTLSYLNGVSYYIDAALALALLSLAATLVTAQFIIRRRGPGQ